jgi:hypothetical protein
MLIPEGDDQLRVMHAAALKDRYAAAARTITRQDFPEVR